MDLSLMIEGQMGLTWPRWRALVDAAERLGFTGLYRSDHFVSPGPPDEDSLEAITSLTYVAHATARVRFGPLVAPVSFRDPVMLARQGAALHEASGGRYVFGIGAGWMAREHEMFGYELLDVRARLDRLEEALEVTTRLLRSSEPVSFTGTFYRLRDATIRPRPEPPPPVMLGGGGIKRTLPLAARFADVWNAPPMPPDAFRERNEILDAALREHAREPSSVRRTMMTSLYTGADGAALEARLDRFSSHPTLGGKPPGEVAAALRAHGILAGTFDEARDQLAGLADAGVEEVMLQWFWLDDLDDLAATAAALLP